MSDIYKHTKSGNLYLFIGYGKETNNANIVVIYKALYEDNQIWVRDYEEFFSKIELQDKLVPRFEKIEVERLPNRF